MTLLSTTVTTTFIEVEETSGRYTLVESSGAAAFVEIVTHGPQGPSGLDLPVLANNPTQGSLVYYDEPTGAFRADATHTFLTTTDGGNF